MIGFILTGHGHFADGLSSAMELVVGKQERYINVNFPSGDTSVELEKNISNAINSLGECEHIIVFADLLSGSPFNTAIMKAMADNRIRVIYGVNFAMLIEAVMNRNAGMQLEAIINHAIDTGKSQIGVFEADGLKDDIDDDNEL